MPRILRKNQIITVTRRCHMIQPYSVNQSSCWVAIEFCNLPPLVQITLSEVCDQNDDSGGSRDLRIASTSRFSYSALCGDFECLPKSLRPLHGSPRAPVDHLLCRGVPGYNSVSKRSCNAQKERRDLRRLRRLRRAFAEMK